MKLYNKIKSLNNNYNIFTEKYKYDTALYKESTSNLNNYLVLDTTELLKTKKSDTCVIFGSGFSLNDISIEEWKELESYDTIGFNWFIYQDFIKLNYLFPKELLTQAQMKDANLVKKKLDEYINLLKKDKNNDCIIMKQHERKATMGNYLFANNLIKKESKIGLYYLISRGKFNLPNHNLEDGLVHGSSTLTSILNFTFIMGWKKIIIAGVDMYDSRYFWNDFEETRDQEKTMGIKNTDLHSTAKNGVVNYLGKWRQNFKKHDKEIYVLNPKSLLSEVLPIHKFK